MEENKERDKEISTGELADDELNSVAGGTWGRTKKHYPTAKLSICDYCHGYWKFYVHECGGGRYCWYCTNCHKDAKFPTPWLEGQGPSVYCT